MGSFSREVDKELLPFVRVYKDGYIERLSGSPLVPLSPKNPQTGAVLSKDLTISQNPPISARLYLPNLNQTHQKLPVLVYFHGGAFIIESAFSFLETRYMTALVSEAKVIAVSVEYRRAPEHSLPVAYQDCWAALHWVASHSVKNGTGEEPWLLNHGDFDRLFVGGDSAGANIAHNLLMQAGSESLPGGVRILGAYLTHPYFWGSKPIGSEPSLDHEKIITQTVWNFVNPFARGGIDNPMINPIADGAPSLAGLGCSRLLVSVAEKDSFGLRDRGVWYYKAVKGSGWKGEVELVEVEGEDHAFHILNFESENAKKLIKRLASFLLK